MLKNILILPLFMITLFSTFMFANTETEYNQKNQIVLNTIQQLEKLGYITEKNAIEAKNELIFNSNNINILKTKPTTEEQTPSFDNKISWTEYITLSNSIKLIAVICLLIAFKGIVMKFFMFFLYIPQYIYQSIVLSFTLTLTFFPQFIWNSQSLYLSIFGVISNIIVLTWIFKIYEQFFVKIFKYISLNMPVHILMSIYLTLYFGFFSIYLNTCFLGIFTAISFVAIFTFSIEVFGSTTYIGYENENFILPGTFISLIILFLYSFINISGINIPYLNIFSVGIEYVITILLTISLLILTSFFNQEEKNFGIFVFLFVLSFILSNIGMILYGLQVIPVIINTGFLIFILGWLNYFVFKINGILAMFIAGITLYGTAIYIDLHPSYFVTSLF